MEDENTSSEGDEEEKNLPEQSKLRKALQIAGAVPEIGGIFSAIASHWSEKEQSRVNEFFRAWVQMLEDELREKEVTIIEIMARLDLTDQAITESEEKRVLIRNIMSNAAASSLTSDDVIRMFLDWIKNFSEMHFQVIGVVYNSNGISRGEMWRRIGQGPVREDSAEADLFKLLIRDLSMGSIIRQHRETDYHGNYIKKTPKRTQKGQGSGTMKSAFDDEEQYELTDLGQQFVHYAMTELTVRIEYENPLKDA
jgi:hypothetical protein